MTVQVHHQNLNPRTLKVPLDWIRRATWMAWILLAVTIVSSAYSVRNYFSERSARPELVSELENEVQELKIALEKKGTTPPVSPAAPQPSGPAANGQTDAKATLEKPPAAPGVEIQGKEGVWSGLAEQISMPAPGSIPSIKLEDAKIDWQGKYANFSVNVVFREPGRGSQQGHLIALGRSGDRIFAHPEGVLNTASGSALFDTNRGEYFSVARFRVLKTRFGPFDSSDQLKEIQVFAFNLNHKLILIQTFKYGK